MVKTIREQTKWKRPHPVTLCQDWEALRKVTEYDYDMLNADFVAYVRARMGYVMTVGDLKSDEVKDDEPGYVRMTRARLQDCWEVYTQSKQ